MPLAQNSIIDPGQVTSRVPLKKSTVVWMIGLVVVLTVVGVLTPYVLGSRSGPKEAPTNDRPVATGRAGDIDAEIEAAERRARNKRPTPPPTPPEPVQVAPLPAPLPAISDIDAEMDSGARTSKSLAFDESKASTSPVESMAGPLDRLRGAVPSLNAPPGEREPFDQGKLVKTMVDAQANMAAQANAGSDKSWLREFASAAGGNKPIRPYVISNPYTLTQGKVIPAVLGRDLNTDLPGEITGCTTLDVYDSITSDHLLIPRGSCFSGQYSSSIKQGQKRVMFAFSRIVMPNGTSFDLPGFTGADLGGAAGIDGNVNNHFLKMFTSSFLIAVIADRFESRNTGPTTSIGGTGGAQSAAGQVLVDTSKTVLDRHRVIPPTITVEKGTRINVEVTRDMEFPGPYRR
jgi:type IV secretory pathway VirB10-like protein